MKAQVAAVSLGRIVALLAFLLSLEIAAAPLRLLPPGDSPPDRRLEPLKDLDGYFPFYPPPTQEAWLHRSERLRRQLLVALGLWPLPTRSPLNAVIHGRVDQQDYTVEKVYFESAPGFLVTGNLYRPKGKPGPHPAILSPHGHWDNGRFMDFGSERVQQEIARGSEQFAEGGRSPLQARCVGLARLGCVVFHYDMLGYADSQQIPMAIAHGFAKQRPEMNTPVNWGLFSPAAEAHGQSVMGLQTWNSIRALDFLSQLPDVDPRRIGVTGASGGGTQTFVLCALDPRPALAFPAVMVSTAMQGGCTCENASGLRVGTGNVEIAALFAPKPLGLTTANDWTKEMATKGYPELEQLFRLMGGEGKLMLHRGEQFDHNYNAPSRGALYGWVNRHFDLGHTQPITERDYQRLNREQLSVWDDQHPAPPGGVDFERRLLRWFHHDAERQLSQARTSLPEFRRVYHGGIEIVLGRAQDDRGTVSWEPVRQADRPIYRELAGWIRNRTHGEDLPVLLLQPRQPARRVALWVHPSGESGLFEGEQPTAQIRRLLEAGIAVAGVDLLYQGEFLPDGKPLVTTRRVKNPREAAAYTFGYNHAVFAQRVHDIMTVAVGLPLMMPELASIDLVGLDGAGPWAAAAGALLGAVIDRLAVDTGGFRFGGVNDLQSPDFLPGGAKYGDLPGMLAAGAPRPLWVAGERPEGLAIPREIYALANASHQLTQDTGPSGQAGAAVVKWLLNR
jgi:dienelactone hydrolase